MLAFGSYKMGESQPSGQETTPKLSAIKRIIIAIALVAAGLVHALVPGRFALDWPTIALVMGGLVLVFVPIENIGAVIESLEFGKTKVLFRNVAALDEKVDIAKASEAEAPQKISAAASPSIEALGEKLQSLLAADKEMALMRVALEIELILARLVLRPGGTVKRAGIVWREAVEFLERRRVIQGATASACLSFRNVRNQIAHPSGTEVPDSLVTRTIDSGLSLIKLLSALEQ